MLVLLVVHGIVAAACGPEAGAPSDQGHGEPTTLVGTAWALVAIQGRQPPAGSQATLAFAPGAVSGDSGCNRFGGSFAYDPASGALTFGGLVSTKRACLEPARNDLEAAFFEALRGVSTATLDPYGRLVLRGSGAELVLAVVPQPAGPTPAPTATG